MARLEIYRDNVLEFQLEIGDKLLRVGRNPTCDLCLNDPAVSREHAELRPTPQGLLLVNLSQYGTRVNTDTVQEGCLLTHGDRIHLGLRYAIKFEGGTPLDLDRTLAPRSLPRR